MRFALTLKWYLSGFTAAVLVAVTSTAGSATTLAQRLGYKADDKLLIVNGDDVGMCHSANLAVIEAQEKGLVRSATVMVPCPWFPEIAAYAKANPDKGFGIHLCHTSEWTKYRWGSVAPKESVPGLFDADGYLWSGVQDVYAHSRPDEALIEGRAQIRKALAAGIDVTHLDSHMGTLQLNPAYVEVYLQLAVEFNLPVRMASQSTLERFGQPAMRDHFAGKGIVFPDYFVYEELKDEGKDIKGFWTGIIKGLKPGVTELYIHPALATDELKAITASWPTRSQEFELFTRDEEFKRLVADQGIILIGYRALRDLQRKAGETLPASATQK
jgi:predicted glycoside hydrolase/deacetylase ChbG (UPF0249 family)